MITFQRRGAECDSTQLDHVSELVFLSGFAESRAANWRKTLGSKIDIYGWLEESVAVDCFVLKFNSLCTQAGIRTAKDVVRHRIWPGGEGTCFSEVNECADLHRIVTVLEALGVSGSLYLFGCISYCVECSIPIITWKLHIHRAVHLSGRVSLWHRGTDQRFQYSWSSRACLLLQGAHRCSKGRRIRIQRFGHGSIF